MTSIIRIRWVEFKKLKYLHCFFAFVVLFSLFIATHFNVSLLLQNTFLINGYDFARNIFLILVSILCAEWVRRLIDVLKIPSLEHRLEYGQEHLILVLKIHEDNLTKIFGINKLENISVKAKINGIHEYCCRWIDNPEPINRAIHQTHIDLLINPNLIPQNRYYTLDKKLEEYKLQLLWREGNNYYAVDEYKYGNFINNDYSSSKEKEKLIDRNISIEIANSEYSYKTNIQI